MMKDIAYEMRRRRLNKQLRISVYPDGRVLVSAPTWLPLFLVRKSVEERKDWIRDKLNSIQGGVSDQRGFLGKTDYAENKERALAVVKERVDFYNKTYKFDFRQISIRNQKSRWGSCSSKKNLSFNYKILFLPEKERDYIVVHELCHLAELNHSKDFWALVAKVFPDYREVRKGLGEGIR